MCVSFGVISLSPTTMAAERTTKTGCQGMPSVPYNIAPSVPPGGKIDVTILAPTTLKVSLDITLKDSNGVPLETAKTCGNASKPLKTAFYDLSESSYSVCYKDICSSATITGTMGVWKNATVGFAVESTDLPDEATGNMIFVVVRFKAPKPTEQTVYGPIVINLSQFEGASQLSTVSTGNRIIEKGMPEHNDTLGGNFANFEPGAYMVCLTGPLTNCSKLFMKEANKNYTAYIDVADTEAKDLITFTGGDKKTCGSEVSAVGWLVCPLINGLTTLNDAMWGIVSGLLTVNPLNQADSIYTAWGAIRSIANVLFAIFFLIIIFSQISNLGITNYGIKKMLPRLIVCAILVNISFIIVQVMVDLANIIGSSLYDLLISITGEVTLGWGSLVNLITGSMAGAGLAVGGVALAGGAAAAFWMLLPMAAMAALGLLTAVLTLIFRQAVIPVLAILAPLAFVAYLLPNTEKWFKKWRDLMISMLMLYPLAALVFGGAQFAANTIIGKGDDWWNLLIGLIILAVPLFSLPFLARQGGSILSAVGGAMSKLAEKARNPISGWSKGHEDLARANYRADTGEHGQIRKLAERTKFGKALYNSPRNFNRNVNGRRMNRETDTDTANKQFKSQLGRNKVGNVDGRSATQRAIHAETTAKSDSLDDAHRFAQGGGVGGKAALNRLGLAEKRGEVDKNITASRVSNLAKGKKLDDKIRTTGIQTQIDSEQSATRVANDFTIGGGAQLHHELGAAKLQTSKDTSEIATNLETDPTLLNLRMENAQSKMDNSTASANTANVFEQASTDAVAVAGTDLAAVTPAMRDSAKATKLASQITASGAQSIKHVTDQEYADAVAKSYDIGGYESNYGMVDREGNEIPMFDRQGNEIAVGASEIPITSEARAAASIDPNGVQHVQAVATAGQSRAKADNVTAAGTLFAAQHYTTDENGDYMKVVMGARRDGAPSTPEEQEAGMDAIVRTGNVKGMAKIQNQIAKLRRDNDPRAAQLQQAYNAMLVTSSKKPKSTGGGALGALAAGTLTDTFEEGLVKYAQAGKFAPSEFASMDKDEIGMLADTLGSALIANPMAVGTTQIADLHVAISGALNDPLYKGSIPPEKRDQLMALLSAIDPTNAV